MFFSGSFKSPTSMTNDLLANDAFVLSNVFASIVSTCLYVILILFVCIAISVCALCLFCLSLCLALYCLLSSVMFYICPPLPAGPASCVFSGSPGTRSVPVF